MQAVRSAILATAWLPVLRDRQTDRQKKNRTPRRGNSTFHLGMSKNCFIVKLNTATVFTLCTFSCYIT